MIFAVPFRNSVIKSIASFFYIGYLPLIPGTFGSLAGLALYYILMQRGLSVLFVACILTVIGFWVSGEAEKIFKKKDDRRIVIDEVCGMLIALIFLPFKPEVAVSAFFLFRLLDTLKPYPAMILQNLKGGVGVMSDDIVAGLYTNIVLQVVFRLATFKAS